MVIEKTFIDGLLLLKPKIFEDTRGYFFESFNQKTLEDIGIKECFVQDNQSLSQKGVLRGMHLQNPPYAQGKLVRVIKGAVQDIVVDIRKQSSTYGMYFSIELNEQNKTMFWIPVGFAHGFLTLQNNTIFHYKCTNYYNKASEISVLWNDKDINISWEIENPLLSEKDKIGIPLKKFVSPF
ncbi:MAG: dTDP-4-dehydrorhamnose 3,5-epimerase [Bacteroidia bacterium]